MNILFIDTETTGLDEKKNTVVEVACRLDVDGKTVDRKNLHFFNPKSATDLGALKVNGLKISDILKMKPEDQGIMELVDWLLDIQKHIKGPLYVCGQNVHFDINFIKALLDRYSIYGVESLIGYKVLDTFGLALALVHVGKLKVEGSLNLGNVAKALGVDLSKVQLHTGKDDVEVTASVLYALLDLMRK